MNKKHILVILAVVCMPWFSGCGEKLPSMADLNNTNIRRVHSLYRIYMDNNGLVGPESKEELKSFLTSDQTAKVLLERMELNSSNIDDVFTSERDGEPFKIRWGLEGVADHAIVFEAVGVEGKREVAFAKTRELDNAEYDGYWSGEIEPDRPGNNAPTNINDVMPEGHGT